MRILYINQFFGLKHEAGSSRPYALAKHLVESGHQVTVLCGSVHYLSTAATSGPKTSVERQMHDGFDMIRVGFRSDFRKSLLHRLMGYLGFAWNALLAGMRLGRQDLVITSIQPIFVGPIGYLISLTTGGRFMLEVRDVWPDLLVYFNMIRNPLLLGPLRLLERVLYRMSRHMVCLTPGIARNLRAKGVPAAKLTVTPTGVETDLFDGGPADRDGFRAKMGWTGKFIAIYTGGLAASDGLIHMLQAAQLLKDRPDIRIVFVGEGNQKEPMRKWVAEHHLDNVEFHPLVSRDVLREWLFAADAGLISLFDNPYADLCLQNKFFDYLGAALPIVGNLRGDQELALRESQAGVCSPLGDVEGLAKSIRELADDTERRTLLIANARRAGYTRYARPAILARYEKLLVRVAAMAPASSSQSPVAAPSEEMNIQPPGIQW